MTATSDFPYRHHFDDRTKRCVRCGLSLASIVRYQTALTSTPSSMIPCAADRLDALTDYIMSGVSSVMRDAAKAYGKLEPKAVIALLLNLGALTSIEGRFSQEDFVRTAGLAYEAMLELEKEDA